MSTLLKLSLAAMSAFVFSTSAQAALVHDYQLNGTLADALGGPSLVPITDADSTDGTITATGFAFNQNSGLQLSNGLLNNANYSIQLDFSFDEVTGYRRIIDFKDRASDNGLYNLGGQIDFFPFTTGTGIFSPGTPVDIVVSRDSVTSEFNVYAEGASILTFVDSASDGVFSAANNVINFFRDDLDFPNEASAGFVDFIRIFDTPLTATQVSCLQTQSPVACGVQIPGPNAVPEPGTLALLSLVGLGFAAFGLRRKQD